MTQNSQNGNAIIIILIAISLFAALAYAFSNNSRSSMGFLTDEETKAYTNQIISYGSEVKRTVKRLQLRGCSDTEISFENTVVTTAYVNAGAPADKSCHVFDIKGGGLNWTKPPPPFYFVDALWYKGKYAFVSSTVWNGNNETCADPSCTDVILILHDMDSKTCATINETLGYSSTPEDSTFGGVEADGTFLHDHTLADEAGGTEAIGKKSACFLRTSDSQYIYTHVVLAR